MKKTSKLYFLKQYITNKNIKVGDYTYFYSFNNEQGAIEFQNKNVLYHFPEVHNDKLIIGKFCAIADEVKFLMNGSNHRINSLSSFPFELFKEFKTDTKFEYDSKGDTIIGHDVWIGYRSTIMPGIKIGTGSIIGTNSVVTKDVPEYSIVAGNPARVIKKRFDQKTIDKLLELKWWDLEEKEIKKLIPTLIKTNFNI